MRIPFLMIVTALFFACGGDTPRDESSRPETPRADAPQPGTPGSEPPPATEKPEPAELFTHGEVALVGPLAGIELGVTKVEELKAKHPDLFEFGGLQSDTWPGVTFHATPMKIRFESREDRVNAAWVRLPLSGTRERLTAVWGEPVPCRDPSGTKINGKALPGFFWFHEKTRVRAVLVEMKDHANLTFAGYYPVEEFMGEDGSLLFGYEKKLPLFGASVEQVKEAYGKDVRFYNNDKSANLDLVLPFEFAVFRIEVLMRAKEGIVNQVSFRVPYDHSDRAKEEWVERWKKKFGKMEEFEEYGQKHWLLNDDPRITLFDQDGISSWQVTITEKK